MSEADKTVLIQTCFRTLKNFSMEKKITNLSRIERKKIETRKRLLRAGYNAMTIAGVEGVSVAKLTTAADIGFGTFYNYFRNIDELASHILACVIDDLGRRNDHATEYLKKSNPAAVQAISIRLTMHEMLNDEIWKWWLRQPEKLAEQMLVSFRPFAVRDLRLGIEAGRYDIHEGEVEAVWSQQVWMLVGGVITMLGRSSSNLDEKRLIEIIMRAMGCSSAMANELSQMDLPKIAEPDVDYSIEYSEPVMG